MTTFTPDAVWKAATEPKCMFSSWLVMHDKVLTADYMARRNWPCNPLCSLCYCLSETPPHLVTQCNFTEATWNVVATRYSLPQFTDLPNAGDPREWMQYLNSRGTRAERKKSGHLIQFLVENLEGTQ
jgi:hypothetical protein